MKTASTELVSFLNSGQQFFMADLYTLTLNGGYTVRYTSWDQDLTVGGNVFKVFRIERSRVRTVVGIEVDTLELNVFADQTEMLNGVPWFSAVQRGVLDSATLTLERLFMRTANDTSLGSIFLFTGRVSDVAVSRTEATLTVKSELELLDTKLPRNLYQAGCLHTLFDNGCQLNKANYAVAGTVQEGRIDAIIANISRTDNHFTLGVVKFTSGVNSGITRAVKYQTSNYIIFALPLVTPASQGDSFIAWPGCDKTKNTCGNKFDNVTNFRGFPYVPTPETQL